MRTGKIKSQSLRCARMQRSKGANPQSLPLSTTVLAGQKPKFVVCFCTTGVQKQKRRPLSHHGWHSLLTALPFITVGRGFGKADHKQDVISVLDKCHIGKLCREDSRDVCL